MSKALPADLYVGAATVGPSAEPIHPSVGGVHHRRESEDVDVDFAWIDLEPFEASDDAAPHLSQSPIAAQDVDAEFGFPTTCEIRCLVGWPMRPSKHRRRQVPGRLRRRPHQQWITRMSAPL